MAGRQNHSQTEFAIPTDREERVTALTLRNQQPYERAILSKSSLRTSKAAFAHTDFDTHKQKKRQSDNHGVYRLFVTLSNPRARAAKTAAV